MTWAELADSALAAGRDTFGETVAYTATGAAEPYDLVAIFDAAGTRVGISSGVAVESVAPRLGVRLADMQAAPRIGDRWRVNGVTYAVREIEPDGHGGASLTGERIG